VAFSPGNRHRRPIAKIIEEQSMAACVLAIPSVHTMPNTTDALLNAADSALRTLFVSPRGTRECPTLPERASDAELGPEERQLSGALMRVNHVGEVCAQALYTAQALAARWPRATGAVPNEALALQLEAAGREETDHLAWTQARLDELGARPSLLNPLWYAGAFGLGLIAGRVGPGVSLGFVVETERQVEAHLASHMDRLPAKDQASRAIVAQMKDDEARHACEAQQAGAVELPAPVKGLMRMAAKVMTTVAHRI
jgi:ubiquinone biosynthesis monooxygenase Coq7